MLIGTRKVSKSSLLKNGSITIFSRPVNTGRRGFRACCGVEKTRACLREVPGSADCALRQERTERDRHVGHTKNRVEVQLAASMTPPLNCGIYFSSSLLATYRTWESTSWKSGFLSLRGKIQQEHNHSSKRKHRDKTQHKTHCLRSTRETLPPSPSPEARPPLRQPGGGGERARVRPRLPAAWFSRMPRRRPSRVCRPRRSAA